MEVATIWASRILATCDGVDPWLVVALMRVESGFRPDAREAGGPGVGILQLSSRYTDEAVALDPLLAIPAACEKLRTWRSTCTGGHEWIAHWFAGNEVNVSAETSAAKVLALAEEIRP